MPKTRPTLRPKKRVSITAVRKMLDVWQERLNLQGWDVYLLEDTEPSPTHGITFWDRNLLSALIKIKLNPKLLTETNASPLSIELTVIHELLHIVFTLDKVDNDPTDSMIFERGLEQTAKSLLAGWGSALK